MVGSRKKIITLIFTVIGLLNCLILMHIYFDTDVKILRKDLQPIAISTSSYAVQADDTDKFRESALSKIKTVFYQDPIDFDNIRTDVDRKEDHMKNKRKEKLRKNFEKKCKENRKFCKDLEQFIAHEEYEFDSYESYNRNWNTSQSQQLSSRKGDANASIKRQLPHILIIGAKKGGTRALLAFLSLHPLIKSPGPELHFFDRFFYRGTTWYRNQLPLSKKGQLTVEKTPAYFVDKEVPMRVMRTIPRVKLLLVVRDPVIRAISDYAQGLSKRGFRPSFENLALKNVSTGMVNVGWGPIRGGLYSKHLQRWLKVFPRSTIHVVSGEGLVRNPSREMDKVQKFLNLERLITEKNFYFNVTKGFPCIVKPEKSGAPNCLGFSKGRTHPKVKNDTLSILREFYRPFNIKFYKMVQQDFGWT